MASERELVNMTERCRLCLVDNGFMISLHDELVESKLKDLTKCTCIDIKQKDHLPHSVCHICLYKLNMWTEFKKQFIRSNKTLFKQLELTEVFDDAIKDSAQNEKDLTEVVKRKRLYQSSEDSNLDIDKKKSKVDSSLEITNVDSSTSQFILDTICVTDDEPASSKNSPQKVLDVLNDSKEKDAENCSEEHTEDKSPLESRRPRLLPAKRGRNIKQRQASTKRWVERKKALFAATGENVTDSDSIVSDDEKLTPAQKARAKTNEDKEAERQKRIAKVLKDLGTNPAEVGLITIHDGSTDFNTRKTRLRNQVKHRNGVEKDISLSIESSMEQISSVENNITANGASKSESQADDKTFIPQSSKTELVIGDTKFIVTSQLIPGDASYFNEQTLNDLMNPKNADIDGDHQEKNTDIIDAVQLRRVNPVVFNANSKFIKRCLDIRIEGHEWLVLKRVQMGLSDFIQKEIKHNLLGVNGDVAKTDQINTSSRQDLDEKLKDLIQKTIQKNMELPVTKDTDSACDEEPATISAEDTKKAVINSLEYQPKVMMNRLNVTKESKVPSINNINALTPISRKRRSVPPIRYNDYSTALDSDSIESDDIVQQIPKANNPRTYRNLAKRSAGMNSQVANVRIMDNVETIKTVDSGVALPVLVGQELSNEQKTDYEDANKIEGAITENHICGVCGLTFNSRKDVEAHVRAHKAAARASSATQVASRNESTSSTTPPQPSKQKKMRCKRCHEIVEACYVKAHAFMCKMKTGLHKCYVCNSTFATQTLFAQHLESHDQSELDAAKVIDNKKLSNSDTLQQAQSTTLPQRKMQNILMKKSDAQSDKVTDAQSDGTKTEEKSKETYNCFLCDRSFTDEEVLKDHLQKHCDDLSEGEENNKEQYQCAICGDTLQSDQALEEHVSKHLFNDEDDTNLISVSQDNEDTAKSNKNKIYHCDKCTMTFNSETSLKTHTDTHTQEELTTDKYQQETTVIYQYQCTLCEELFDTEEEMAEHLELHNGDAQVCLLCDKPFRTLEELQEHVATH